MMKTVQKRIIRNWLYSGLFLVALMVIIGGITRLTNSGLSMVKWELIMDITPPINELQWEEKFQDYQAFPEYQKFNQNMSVSEFKTIYFWEWLHRFLARLLGIIFIIPFLLFWAKNWLNKKLKKQLLILFLLGGLQAFLGAYMVESGLEIGTVNHFRLAVHLVVSFTIMCYTYWLILSFTEVEKNTNKTINKLSQYLIIALLIQIIYGAFVAGKDAGYLLPANEGVFESVFGYTLRNTNDFSLLSNGFDIQAFHRLFAWIVFTITLIIFNKTRKTTLAKAGTLVLGVTIAQIILGISTLLLRVQIHTAITHQFIAIILLLSVVRLTYLSSEKSQLSA